MKREEKREARYSFIFLEIFGGGQIVAYTLGVFLLFPQNLFHIITGLAGKSCFFRWVTISSFLLGTEQTVGFFPKISLLPSPSLLAVLVSFFHTSNSKQAAGSS